MNLISFIVHFALLSCSLYTICFAQPNTENVVRNGGALIGVTVAGETVLDVVKIDPDDFSVDVILPNATEVNIKGLTPGFSTAICESSQLFLVGINDAKNPRLLVVDLKLRKTKGTIHANGVLIDNIECDSEGNGFAYVFQLGKQHTVVKMNFATMQYAKLMHTSYKSYGGSALDSRNKRFFTVANTPYYDSFNYSINVMEYSSSKEYLTLPFKGYSIGGIVYDPVLQKLFGFVQTPAGVEEKVKYKTFLAQIQLDRGTVDIIAGPWERVALIDESGLTLDVHSHMIYAMTESKVRKIDVVNRKMIFERSAAALPWPVKCYEFISNL